MKVKPLPKLNDCTDCRYYDEKTGCPNLPQDGRLWEMMYCSQFEARCHCEPDQGGQCSFLC